MWDEQRKRVNREARRKADENAIVAVLIPHSEQSSSVAVAATSERALQLDTVPPSTAARDGVDTVERERSHNANAWDRKATCRMGHRDCGGGMKVVLNGGSL